MSPVNTLFRLILLAFYCFSYQVAANAFQIGSQELDAERTNFFESKIRPVLIEHCIDCHGVQTEQSGGLALDSRLGWQQGGDHGAAVIPGNSQQSLLLTAIAYKEPRLQMPPDGKLSDQIIEDFRIWIEQGAADPRELDNVSSKQMAKGSSGTALSVQDAQSHWAYRPPTSVEVLCEKSEVDLRDVPVGQAVDFWIDQKLSQSGIQVAASAKPADLVRRLYFDLSGLPPTPEQLDFWLNNFDAARYGQLVDHLLSSSTYGETFARRWMDVVRYGDSITLRGFVLPQAWRYRDYLIESFNQDESIQQMISQQVAGDLMTATDPSLRSRQLIATTFLALGNTNLEKQDKDQLDMDYLDEQLDVIGAAFLGQTLGCARCHDHKFDPIPTKDYYALAGILKSATGMKHENVSAWLEFPLPLPESQLQHFQALELEKKQISEDVKRLKKQQSKASGERPRKISPQDLPGIVVDSAQATLIGNWVQSQFTTPLVGESYLHDANAEKGLKSITFEPAKLPPGEYEVLLAYQAGDNRATEVVVQIASADGDHEIKINQQKPPSESNLWISLGRYRFEVNGQKYVLISNANTKGHVVADAVLFLPVSEIEGISRAAALSGLGKSSLDQAEVASSQNALKQLERRLAQIQSELDSQPKYMGIREDGPGQDIAINIRGDVHSLGAVVPRGFLTAIGNVIEPTAAPTRLELAEWLVSPQNPLTSRVYVNRVWSWLMGQGLVRTLNNFGTTGQPPSHPELLDWLAGRFMQEGWSTKWLVREIVMSKAYQRRLQDACEVAYATDPDNRLYWRGQLRRLPVEALRDAMLSVSGELDLTVGGCIAEPGLKVDYNYKHRSTRRSIYHPVFRNSLPELYDEFDFADSSVSVEVRGRSTVASQALALMQSPWVVERSLHAAQRFAPIIQSSGLKDGLDQLYMTCLSRPPSDHEMAQARQFILQTMEDRTLDPGRQNQDDLDSNKKVAEYSTEELTERLALLIQVIMASVDFRFLN